MTEEVQGVGETEARVDAQNQASEQKVFTQEQLDKILEDRLKRERAKFERQFEGVDPERYRKLNEEEENRRIEAMKKREEFDNILKETVTKKDTVIQQLRSEIHSVKVEGSLLNEASRNKAVNPEQVVRLLRENVRLSETGAVEVVGPNGQVQYNESGDPLTVAELVNDFLKQNPHFVNANSSGSGISSKTQPVKAGEVVDLKSLDMNNPAHRELYKKYRNQT